MTLRFFRLVPACAVSAAAASSLKRSVLSKGPGEDLANFLGKGCWLSCGERAGYCSFCGKNNACCSTFGSDVVPECAQTIGFVEGSENTYQCVESTAQIKFEVDSATYGSTGAGSVQVDVTSQVNSLLSATGGIMDLTAGLGLAEVFGNLVPGAGMVLSMSKGEHSLEFTDAGQDPGGGVNIYSVVPLLHEATRTGVRSPQPSIFIAVFSLRESDTRRGLIRDMWNRAVGFSGNVTMKFTLCEAADDLEYKVQAEHNAHGDIMQLPCQEGEGEAKRTHKLLAAMAAYRNSLPIRDFFMKIDDDTFVAWHRLATFLNNHAGNLVTYAGIPLESTAVCRTPSSKLYEPPEIFPGEAYPRTMSTEAGTVVGGTLVKFILDRNIGTNNMLHVEERALAVWVCCREVPQTSPPTHCCG